MEIFINFINCIFYGTKKYCAGHVDVDAFRGRAQVSVPIYTLNKGEVSIPVSLDYIAKGVKVAEEGKEFGLGWGLNAGGLINRRLKDLPDDKTAGGWLFGNNATLVESFAITNDSNLSTCQDESTDISYLSTNLPVTVDAEPDVFEVSAAGISCRIVFDKNHQPRTIPYTDFKISYTTDHYGINSFTVVNDQGIAYYFALPDLTSKTTKTTKATVPYFNREYRQYTTKVQYYSTWYLQRVTDAKGNSVTLGYVNNYLEDRSTPIEITERSAGGGFVKNVLYNVNTQVTPKQLVNIDGGANNGVLSFTYNGTSKELLEVAIPGGDLIGFWYSTINSRLFLKRITNLSCNPNPLYKFSYNGENPATSIALPSTGSAQQDPWGYYNAGTDTVLTPKIYVYPAGSSAPNIKRYRFTPILGYSGASFILPGADRSVNASSVMAGVLNKITYPTGGSTTLEYESNSYFDADIQAVQNGGGIRVKKITDYDGLDSSKNMVRTYGYILPATSVSSGKLINMPSMAFTRAYTGTAGTQSYWEFSTIRSPDDLSIESTDVIYSSVTMQQSGRGRLVTEYTTPGTYWDLSAPDWVPSVSYYGRAACGTGPTYPDMGALVNATNTYPYAMNPNYAFERGLVKSVTAYNESNVPVSKEEFTYQRSNTPQIISGLRIDDIEGFKAYTKYNFLASTGNLTATKISSAFDLNDPGKFMATTTSFVYGSASHKKATKSSVTNSDGIINNSYVRYAKDYVTSNNGDAASKALSGLQEINSNALIETYNSIIRPGEPEKFVSGELSTYKAIAAVGTNVAMYVPGQSFRFVNNNGDLSFLPSQVTAQTTFTRDAKYMPVSNYESYHQNGLASTISSADNSLVSYHFMVSTGLPLTTIINAKHNQVISCGFDADDTETSFSLVNPSYTLEARTGSRALSAPVGYSFQKMVNKGNAKNYVFSCWVKSASGGTLTITLTGTNSTTAGSVLNYGATAGWKYYEVMVPVSNMTDDFTAKVQNNAAVAIDDVLFYPENAELTTFSYDINGNKLSQTNSNGLATYYEYDRQGRLKLVRDQDLNIIRKESNIAFNVVMAEPYISYETADKFDGDNIVFSTAINSCYTGFTYTWNFGDGSPSSVTSEDSMAHVFLNPGTYTVTLTQDHPEFGSKTTTRSVLIKPKSLIVSICASGIVNFDNCFIDEPYIVTCPGVTLDSQKTTFTVTSISGCPAGATYTYQWETSGNNGLTWNPVGTGSSYSGQRINTARAQQSYQVRCKVSSSCGRTGVGTAMFIAYKSSPDCL